jgi:DNA-binding response OmpR family regulator
VDRPVVLVVEDEQSLRLLCRINLELEGFDVVEAASLAEARAALEVCEPAVVLLDLGLGRDNGAELLPDLKAPVALLTGSATVEPEVASSAAARLPKPFSIADLISTVTSLAAR